MKYPKDNKQLEDKVNELIEELNELKVSREQEQV